MGLFCKHEWEEIKYTRHLYNVGSSKEAKFKCCKCGKEKWFDIFKVPKNTYVFKEYDKGSISDGSHTFDELYEHRMVLFSVICNIYPQNAWKSWLHEDGTMYDDYFIVGLTTPEGDYSYHYYKDNWGYFNVKELPRAPKWDGHTPGDIERLRSLCYNSNLIDLMAWLKGEKYITVDEHSTTMSEKFENEHKYELITNITINKIIKKIKEMTLQNIL